MGIDDFLKVTGKVVVRSNTADQERLIKRLFESGLSAEKISAIVPAERIVVSNLVMTLGRQLIFKLLDGVNANINQGLKYLAIGTGTAAPAINQSQLANENFRKLITSFSFDGTTIYCDTFISADEANFTWQEVGMFGNYTAESGADTGEMFSRALLNQTKTSTQTKTVSWQITLS